MKEHITARIDSGLVKKIREQANEEGRSFSNMVERLLSKNTTITIRGFDLVEAAKSAQIKKKGRN